MQRVRRILSFLAIQLVLLTASPAWAQEAEQEEKDWVLAYIFTGLLVSLGIAAVAYGTNREINEERKLERKEAQAKEERLKKLEEKK